MKTFLATALCICASASSSYNGSYGGHGGKDDHDHDDGCRDVKQERPVCKKSTRHVKEKFTLDDYKQKCDFEKKTKRDHVYLKVSKDVCKPHIEKVKSKHVVHINNKVCEEAKGGGYDDHGKNTPPKPDCKIVKEKRYIDGYDKVTKYTCHSEKDTKKVDVTLHYKKEVCREYPEKHDEHVTLEVTETKCHVEKYTRRVCDDGPFDDKNYQGDYGGYGDHDKGGYGDMSHSKKDGYGGYGDHDKSGYGDMSHSYGGYDDHDKGGYGGMSHSKGADYGGYGDHDKGSYGGMSHSKNTDYGGYGDHDKGGYGGMSHSKQYDYGGYEDHDKSGYGGMSHRKNDDYGGYGDHEKGGYGSRDSKYGGYGDHVKVGYGDHEKGGYGSGYNSHNEGGYHDKGGYGASSSKGYGGGVPHNKKGYDNDDKRGYTDNRSKRVYDEGGNHYKQYSGYGDDNKKESYSVSY